MYPIIYIKNNMYYALYINTIHGQRLTEDIVIVRGVLK